MKTIFKPGTIFLCSTILFVVVGCGALQELDFTRNKPKESDLIGTYEPDAKTQARIAKNGGTASSNCQIKIHADGKIEFLDMPVWWKGGSGDKELISTNGIWRLEKNDHHWQIVWEHNNTIDFELNLMGQKPPYKIDIYVGDPDSDLFLIFEHTQN